MNTQAIRDKFASLYGEAGTLYTSPGRINLIGEHTDYNGAFVFPGAIDKLGKYTSAGSGALMMGIVGGAILPFAQGILADSLGGWQFTWIIVVIGEAYLLYYALVGHKVRQLP